MEGFIDKPNIPSGAVSLALVDGRMRKSAIYGLEKAGIKLIHAGRCSGLYEAVSCHPDMFVHHIGGNNLVAAPNSPSYTIEELKRHGFNIINGRKIIMGKYPYDVAYNVARIDKYAICNVKYTDEVLLSHLVDMGVVIIDVKQGYTKCSVCIAGPGIIITSDDGVYRSLLKYDFEVLRVSPGFIQLNGLDYGFIGGASGMISNSTLSFAGNPGLHPDFKNIEKFLDKHQVNIKMLDGGILQDVGTIIPLKEMI